MGLMPSISPVIPDLIKKTILYYPRYTLSKKISCISLTPNKKNLFLHFLKNTSYDIYSIPALMKEMPRA